jgi:hypothetical protein
MKDPILFTTCTMFIIPMTYAAYCRFWYIYGTLLALLLPSATYHSSKDILLMRIDQLALLHLLAVSFKTAYELNLVYLPSIGTVWSVYIYMYGYKTRTLAFSPHYVESSLYHSSMHLILTVLWTYGIYVKQGLSDDIAAF